MPNDKVEMTQKEFDEVYLIKGDNSAKSDTPLPKESMPVEDTTPEFLTKEETEQDKLFHADLKQEEEDAN